MLASKGPDLRRDSFQRRANQPILGREVVHETTLADPRTLGELAPASRYRILSAISTPRNSQCQALAFRARYGTGANALEFLHRGARPLDNQAADNLALSPPEDQSQLRLRQVAGPGFDPTELLPIRSKNATTGRWRRD